MTAWSSLLPPSAQIPRIAPPEFGRFKWDYELASRPAVITGAIDHWAALKRWSPAYLKDRYGAQRASSYVLRDGAIVRDRVEGLRMEGAPVAEVMDNLESARRDSYRLKESLTRFPGLADDVETPRYCRGRLGLEAYLWATPRGSTTILHWDTPHNLFAQVSGEKTFVLFSPDQAASLYPHSFWSSTPQCSRVDVTRPDLARFPALAQVRPLACTLAPGDMLFMPSRWWHCGESTTATISVNFWWLSLPILPRAVVTGVRRWVGGRKY